MPSYLEMWSVVVGRPTGGGLKATGQINRILLEGIGNMNRAEARLTFDGLIREIQEEKANNVIKGPVYRMFYMDERTVMATFKKDQMYISPCFEAFSKQRLEPGNGVPVNYNTRLVIIDARIPGADLEKFNKQQKEVLIQPGTMFAVTAVRTNLGVKEIGLTYIGDPNGDLIRAKGKMAIRIG